MTNAEKEKIIVNYMSNLQIDKEEAEQLFKDDYSDEVLPEVAEIEKKVKEMGRRYEKSDKTRKKSTRERKVDEVKKVLIERVVAELEKDCKIVAIQTETEIKFSFQDEDYTFKLTKHRKKKEGILYDKKK